MIDPTLPDGDYPFGTEVYPLREPALHEPPSALARSLADQRDEKGDAIVRDRIVEIVCRGGQMEGHCFVVFWPSAGPLHLLVPKSSFVGKA